MTHKPHVGFYFPIRVVKYRRNRTRIGILRFGLKCKLCPLQLHNLSQIVSFHFITGKMQTVMRLMPVYCLED